MRNDMRTSHPINPNNTGSLWCAKHAKDWSTTTHFEYYRTDKQVHLGANILTILAFLTLITVSSLIIINCFLPGESKIALLGLPIGAILAFVDHKIRKARRKEN